MASLNATAMDFADVVQKCLDEYGDACTEALTEIVPKVAKDAAKRLKQNSPKKSGKYAKGWTTTVEKGRAWVAATVHGKSGTYQLAHLLEHGHATRNGGRVGGRTHIKPVESWAVDEVGDRLTEKLEGGA